MASISEAMKTCRRWAGRPSTPTPPGCRRSSTASRIPTTPRCLDWAEAMAGGERDFSGLTARWVMWLDVPRQMRKHKSVAYKPITGKRDTQLGISKGSPAFLLDDPDGDSWCMKPASLIVDP